MKDKTIILIEEYWDWFLRTQNMVKRKSKIERLLKLQEKEAQLIKEKLKIGIS